MRGRADGLDQRSRIREPIPLRLLVASNQGDVLAELKILLGRGTVGQAGGAERAFTDDAELLSGVIQISPPDEQGRRSLGLSLSLGEIFGRQVMEVMPFIRLLSQFRPPNEFQLEPAIRQQGVGTWGNRSGRHVTHEGLVHLEDLATLQAHAEEPILVPEEVDPRFANELRQLVRMLDGEVITGSWDQVTLNMQVGVSRSEAAKAFAGKSGIAMDEDISITFDKQEINLGRFTTMLHAAQVDNDQPDDDSLLRLVPADDTTFTRRIGLVY